MRAVSTLLLLASSGALCNVTSQEFVINKAAQPAAPLGPKVVMNPKMKSKQHNHQFWDNQKLCKAEFKLQSCLLDAHDRVFFFDDNRLKVCILDFTTSLCGKLKGLTSTLDSKVYKLVEDSCATHAFSNALLVFNKVTKDLNAELNVNGGISKWSFITTKLSLAAVRGNADCAINSFFNYVNHCKASGLVTKKDSECVEKVLENGKCGFDEANATADGWNLPALVKHYGYEGAEMAIENIKKGYGVTEVEQVAQILSKILKELGNNDAQGIQFSESNVEGDLNKASLNVCPEHFDNMNAGFAATGLPGIPQNDVFFHFPNDQNTTFSVTSDTTGAVTSTQASLDPTTDYQTIQDTCTNYFESTKVLFDADVLADLTRPNMCFSITKYDIFFIESGMIKPLKYTKLDGKTTLPEGTKAAEQCYQASWTEAKSCVSHLSEWRMTVACCKSYATIVKEHESKASANKPVAITKHTVLHIKGPVIQITSVKDSVEKPEYEVLIKDLVFEHTVKSNSKNGNLGTIDSKAVASASKTQNVKNYFDNILQELDGQGKCSQIALDELPLTGYGKEIRALCQTIKDQNARIVAQKAPVPVQGSIEFTGLTLLNSFDKSKFEETLVSVLNEANGNVKSVTVTEVSAVTGEPNLLLQTKRKLAHGRFRFKVIFIVRFVNPDGKASLINWLQKLIDLLNAISKQNTNATGIVSPSKLGQALVKNEVIGNSNQLNGDTAKNVDGAAVVSTPTTPVPVPTTPVPVPTTPVPATPVPATPVPATPVPATPVPATPVPATPVPATPVPATPVPATPVPATPVPATPVPATPVPATPVPATPVPATPVPATPVPATPVPATPTPGAVQDAFIKDVVVIAKSQNSLYNLIITDFSCHNSQFDFTAKDYCPNLPEGTYLSDHDEKYQMMQATTARMFPIDFKNSIYVKDFEYYNNAENTDKCGKEQENPYYLSQNAAQHTRYFAKSRAECDPALGRYGHNTCPSDCNLFTKQEGSCSGRMQSFIPYPRGSGFIKSEALCGDLEGCMKQDEGHCGIFFNPARTFYSIGLYENKNMVVSGWRDSPVPHSTYPLAMASHFNRATRAKRTFVAGDDTAALMFQTVYYDATKKNVLGGYLIYQGQRHLMTNTLSRNGEKWRGIYELEFTDLPTTCEPYYFYFKLEDGTSLRLPEDPRYMYGTAGINGCTENHYYDTNFDGLAKRSFAANAGPSVLAPDFKSPGLTGNACLGCVKVSFIDAEDPTLLPLASTTNNRMLLATFADVEIKVVSAYESDVRSTYINDTNVSKEIWNQLDIDLDFSEIIPIVSGKCYPQACLLSQLASCIDENNAVPIEAGPTTSTTLLSASSFSGKIPTSSVMAFASVGFAAGIVVIAIAQTLVSRRHATSS